MASEDSQSAGARKSSAAAAAAPIRPQEQGLKCPRCDSPNTKFCYYNNYSLTQPRHFCKTCRRYWTKGGALRNVPVGGGCRKAKKSKSSAPSSSSSRLTSDMTEAIAVASDPVAGLKFFDPGLGPASVDFQLGVLPFSRLQTPSLATNQLISFSGVSSEAGGSSAFSYPIHQTVGRVYGENISSSNIRGSLASSIESLSSINQELHWKLQQQRLAMLFGEEANKDGAVAALPSPLLDGHPESVPFPIPESSKAGTKTWFLDTSFVNTPAGNAIIHNNNNTSTNSSSSSTNNNNTGSWNGLASWNDMHQFTTMP